MGLLQPCHQSPKFMVGIGNFPVIRVVRVSAAKRLRRIIRTMRIIQMKPKEKRSRLIFLQPRERAINALSGSPVHQSDIASNEGLRGKRVVVKIETSRQSP